MSNTQKNNLNFFSKNISNLLFADKNFKLYQNNDIFHTPTKTSISFKKLVSALSLTTLKLYQFLMRSNLKPKQFTTNEKLFISQLLKNKRFFPAHRILSNKIRALAP